MNENVKKKDKAAQFIDEHLHLFQCPVCEEIFDDINDYQLRCINNHSFDISKKGTVHFLLNEANNQYDKEQLSSRFRTAQTGFWKPILEECMKYVEKPEGVHLDVGCGEGSHMHMLTELGLRGSKIGFDISKAGINLAAANYPDAFWCVADLADSPFKAAQFDTVFNIFSPSNYHEFNRLLKEEGKCIKVVPNAGYLKELRTMVSNDPNEYSNENVVNNFLNHYPNAKKIPIKYTFTFDNDEIKFLFNMTPLTWGAADIAKEKILEKSSLDITVDVTLLIGTK